MTEMHLPPPSEDETALLTIERAAQKLAVSERYVLRLIATGQLPVIWLGQKTKRIDPMELRRLLTAKTLAPGRSAPPRSKNDSRNMQAARAALMRNRALRQEREATTMYRSLPEAERALSPSIDDDMEL